MNLSLNVSNDQELRDFIKTLITDQVKAITREHFKEAIEREVERKIKGMSTYDFNRFVNAAFDNAMKKIINEALDVKSWNNDFIKPFIEKHLSDLLNPSRINDLVNNAANEKIKNMLR